MQAYAESARPALPPTSTPLLRIVAGLAFAQHGAQKLFGVLGGTAVELTSQRGLAGMIEFVGGILIALGLFTSPVAFLASGEMAWAYFQSHAPRGFWPIQNGGELARALLLHLSVLRGGRVREAEYRFDPEVARRSILPER